MYCEKCGSHVSDDTKKYCSKCGNLLHPSETKTVTKAKKTVVIGIVLVSAAIVLVILSLLIITAKKRHRSKPADMTASAVTAIEEVTTDITTDATIIETLPRETEPSAPISENNHSTHYILADSNARYYTRNELLTYSKADLRLARNEIYARLGRQFQAEDLQNYFSSKSWYTPEYQPEEFDAKGDTLFNEFEQANLKLITELENGSGNEAKQEVDYKGDYVIRGEECVWVHTYYIIDEVLYIEGSYCDAIYNPDADNEGETYDFIPIRDSVLILIDENTNIDNGMNMQDIYDIKDYIDQVIYHFQYTCVMIDLEGNYVTAYHGNWQSS